MQECTVTSDGIHIVLTNGQLAHFYFIKGFNKFSELKSVSINILESVPEINVDYDDVVEVSFVNESSTLGLCQWAHEQTYPLELPEGTYRVRYSVKGMGKEHGEGDDWETPVPGQRHLIQLWQSEINSDAILKSQSEPGCYWHKTFGGND